jgi:RHS repeat-associated protein
MRRERTDNLFNNLQETKHFRIQFTVCEGNDNYGEEERSVYYYHGDHLGSAQLVTDYRGEVYEHIEYTPYGELWVEEVRAGEEKTPFRFTGKELDSLFAGANKQSIPYRTARRADEETGLYYYDARYLDPQTSRWLSTDPAMGEYIPQAPVNEEARKHNQNLPGMGGVFNVVNLHVYHYAGNNPVKYIDPTGDFIIMIQFSLNAGIGTGLDGNFGAFLCIPTDGGDISAGFYTSGAVGAYFSYGAAAGGGVTIAPFANDFSDIEGFSIVAGGSLPSTIVPGGSITGEIGINPQAKNTLKSLTIAVTGSWRSKGMSAEGHIYTIETLKLGEINVSNLLREIDIDTIMDFIREGKFEELGEYVTELFSDSIME